MVEKNLKTLSLRSEKRFGRNYYVLLAWCLRLILLIVLFHCTGLHAPASWLSLVFFIHSWVTAIGHTWERGDGRDNALLHIQFINFFVRALHHEYATEPLSMTTDHEGPQLVVLTFQLCPPHHVARSSLRRTSQMSGSIAWPDRIAWGMRPSI